MDTPRLGPDVRRLTVVLGADWADGVLLEGDDIRVAAVLGRLGVAALERANGGAVPAAAVALRDQLAGFAAETAKVVVSDGRAAAKPGGVVVLAGSGHAQMTVRAAATLLGVSPQRVRGLCRAGVLLATRDPAGRWAIDANEAAALAARRKGA